MAVAYEVEAYVSKLSPRKGDIVVLEIRDQHNLEALAKAQGILGELGECAKAGLVDPEVPIVVVYGEDRLQCMGAKQLGYLIVTEDGLQVSKKAVDSIAALATLYMMNDGRVVSVPHKK